MTRSWPDIRGWCADCDRNYLHDIIVANQARTVVEIGVYAGRMTIALAAAVRRTGGVVHCVDPWQEMPNGAEVARLFLDTLTRYSLQDVVRIHAETSVEFAARLAGAVDLVWIDGGHRYANVMADLSAWQPRSATTFGHDWHLPDVRTAAQDYAEANGLETFRLVGTDNIWTVGSTAIPANMV